MDDEIKPDDVFVHNETQQFVIVVAAGSMKVENSQWYDSVSYRNPTGNNPDRMFTRCAVAFREKFTRVKEQQS